MVSPAKLLNKIVQAVALDDDLRVTFTDRSVLVVFTEWDDYAECDVIKVLYENTEVETGYVVDDA